MVLSSAWPHVERRQLDIQIRGKHTDVVMIELLSMAFQQDAYRDDRLRDARSTRFLCRVDRVIDSFVTKLCVAIAITSRRRVNTLDLILRLANTHAYSSRIKNLGIHTSFLLHVLWLRRRFGRRLRRSILCLLSAFFHVRLVVQLVSFHKTQNDCR